MRTVVLAIALALLPVFAWAQAAGPVATLDRTRIGVGETVTLNIEVGDGDDDSPDLSALGTDFVVLGTSTNHSLSVVNGRREAHTILGIALRPRREGRLTVPALSIGGQRTQPLSLDVEASSSGPAASADRPVVLEGKADPTHAYVGQQIDYTLRLYFAVNLADGQLGDPAAEGAEVRRLGQDANFQTVRGGRRFNVVERHYAIFPQHPGTLDIQAPAFQGTAVDPSDANAFFGGGSPVNAVAERQRVDVVARPSTAGDGAWIPARELKLSLEGMPADGKARVGQPITLTMRLDATGMPFEALPALSLPTIDGADVYPDKAVTGGGTSGPWVTGRRQQSFAVVPGHAGTLHIPETTLHWWNVVTDKAEVATLPAHDLDVVGAAGAVATKPGVPAAATTSPPSTDSPSIAFADGVPWRWLFIGVAALWILTVVAWVIHARRRKVTSVLVPPPMPTITRERPAREAFLQSTKTGDVVAMEFRLIDWARAVRPSIRSTSALSAALRVGAQPEAIAMLQRARFGGGVVDGAVLHDAFAKGLDWAPAPDSGESGGLPPLYPR